MDVLEVIGLLVGGGGLTYLGDYLINRRKAKVEEKQVDQSEFKAVIEEWKEDNRRLREKEKENEDRIQELEKQVHALSFKLQLLESAHSDLPVPQWLKDTNGVMLSINSEYTKVFGKTPEQYINNTDFDVWDEDTARAFTANDMEVMRTKEVLHKVEAVPMPDGKTVFWRIIKYPRYAGNILIGIGGVAFQKVHDEAKIDKVR